MKNKFTSLEKKAKKKKKWWWEYMMAGNSNSYQAHSYIWAKAFPYISAD